jgi:hypothetical protein
MSWHSTGLEQADHHFLPSSSQFQSTVASSHFLGPNFTTCEVNGAITPITHPLAGEPFVQDAFTPLDEISSQDFDDRYGFLNEFSANKDNFYESSCYPQYPVPTESRYQYPTGLYEMQKQPEYYFRQLEETAPPTPEIVPLQASTGLTGESSFNAAEQSGKDDLIGMGLYDAPSPMPASTSFFSGPWDIPIRPALGKGLKLEETFQPTATEYDEDEAASGEDEEEEEPDLSQTNDLTMPYLGLEERRSCYGQNTFGELNLASDINREENPRWSTDFTANYGWV